MENNVRHILLVDNYTNKLVKLYNYLLFRSYPVELVNSTESAIDYIINRPVSVIVSQVSFLNTDITDLIQQLKGRLSSPPIVVIMDDELAERAIEALDYKFRYMIHDLSELKENEKLIASLHKDNPAEPVVNSPLVTWSENYSFAIPSDPSYIDRVIRYLLDKTAGFKLVEPEENALQMSLSEAIANAIEHGNKFNPQKNVFIEFEIDSRHITIFVQDQGEGFEFENSDKSLKKLNEQFSVRGRGLLIIQKFMDELEVISPGNKIRMTKFFHPNGEKK